MRKKFFRPLILCAITVLSMTISSTAKAGLKELLEALDQLAGCQEYYKAYIALFNSFDYDRKTGERFRELVIQELDRIDDQRRAREQAARAGESVEEFLRHSSVPGDDGLSFLLRECRKESTDKVSFPRDRSLELTTLNLVLTKAREQAIKEYKRRKEGDEAFESSDKPRRKTKASSSNSDDKQD